MKHFARPRKFNPNVNKVPAEIEQFVEDRKHEYLEFLTQRGWEDTPGRRKNFAWNHYEYPSFEHEYYLEKSELSTMRGGDPDDVA